jgi:hypothetical protein
MAAHALIFVPAVGFVLAAGAGVLIRARRARQDERVRDEFTITYTPVKAAWATI